MLRIAWVLPLVLLLALACGDDDSSGHGGRDPAITPGAGTFEEGDCPFDESELPDEDLTCGTLTVPADRDDPDTRDIELAVAIFGARDRDPLPDPVIYLDGGPGGNTLETISLSFDALVDPFLDERDFIVFDQRGVGYSEPELSCRFLDRLYAIVDQEIDPEEYKQDVIDRTRDCSEDKREDGIDPGLANSAESAADLEDLRLALGYDEWNLYGISYGTRLALTTMRDYPDGLRSVILDSTYPPEVDLDAEIVADFDRALRVLFDDCAADDNCSDKYPDLEDVFYETVDDLNDDPEQIGGGFFGEEDILLTGDTFLSTVFQTLYITEILPQLPEFIYQTNDGDYELAGLLISSFQQQAQYFTTGMYLSVQCTEEVPFTSQEKIEATLDEYPKLAGAFAPDLDAEIEQCEAWGAAPADPLENEPVESDVPTLVMSGSYDPITPPRWGQAVADRLQTAYFFEFPDAGHGVIPSSACAERLAEQFLDDPEEQPDAACLDRLGPPEFQSGFGF